MILLKTMSTNSRCSESISNKNEKFFIYFWKVCMGLSGTILTQYLRVHKIRCKESFVQQMLAGDITIQTSPHPWECVFVGEEWDGSPHTKEFEGVKNSRLWMPQQLTHILHWEIASFLDLNQVLRCRNQMSASLIHPYQNFEIMESLTPIIQLALSSSWNYRYGCRSSFLQWKGESSS